MRQNSSKSTYQYRQIYVIIVTNHNSTLPKYLDAHKMSGFDEASLRQARDSPKDEFESRIMIYCTIRRR